MCEPYHSIIQTPTQDDQGRPYDKMFPPPEKGGSWIGRVIKKIREWFHLSKLGAGHSGGSNFAGLSAIRIPTTGYEAHWWDRKVTRDGWYHGEDFDKELALEAATTYAHRTSIGNLHLLRQFLEVSMRNSNRPHGYVQMVLDKLICTAKRAQVANRMRKAFSWVLKKNANRDWINALLRAAKDGVISFILGLTRKRNLLVPEWADDTTLWTPDREQRDAGLPVPQPVV